MTESNNEDGLHVEASQAELEKKWEIIKAPFKVKYPMLTENDLNYESVGFEKMINTIATKLEKRKNQVKREIQDWEVDDEEE